MQFKKVALSLSAGLAIASAQIETADNATCHDYVLVSIRGTGEKQGPSIGFVTAINWIMGNLTNGVQYNPIYPASTTQLYQEGSANTVDFINKGLQNCPNQKYALLGYSQGASTVKGALFNFTDPDSAAYKAIKAVWVIGNPYRTANKTNDVDENGTGANRQYHGCYWNETSTGEVPEEDLFGPGIPEIYYSSNKLLDICYTDDPICSPGAPGNLTIVNHLKYIGDQNVQGMGAKHIIDALSGSGNSSSSSTNGTSSSGGTSGSNGTSSASPSGTSSSTTSGSSGTPTSASAGNGAGGNGGGGSGAGTTTSTPASNDAPAPIIGSSLSALVLGVAAAIFM